MTVNVRHTKLAILNACEHYLDDVHLQREVTYCWIRVMRQLSYSYTIQLKTNLQQSTKWMYLNHPNTEGIVKVPRFLHLTLILSVKTQLEQIYTPLPEQSYPQILVHCICACVLLRKLKSTVKCYISCTHQALFYWTWIHAGIPACVDVTYIIIVHMYLTSCVYCCRDGQIRTEEMDTVVSIWGDFLWEKCVTSW